MVCEYEYMNIFLSLLNDKHPTPVIDVLSTANSWVQMVILEQARIVYTVISLSCKRGFYKTNNAPNTGIYPVTFHTHSFNLTCIYKITLPLSCYRLDIIRYSVLLQIPDFPHTYIRPHSKSPLTLSLNK